MEMKKIFGYIMVLLGMQVHTSCESFLDRQEDEALTFDKVWETRTDTRRYWLTTMSFLPRDANDFSYSPWSGAADEVTVNQRDREFHTMTSGAWNPSNVPYEKMSHYYRGIRECNLFLGNVDRCTDPLLTETEKETWKVQTRFARAYYYFMMMRSYGPVFILHDELLDFTLSAAELARPRDTWDDCVDYVVGELNDLIESPYMKLTWESASEKGLATKGACQALISRLTLYSARDLFNGNKMYASVINPDGTHLFPQEYDANKWKIAAEAAYQIIDGGQYSLYHSENNNPYDNYYGITQETWNSELIWTTGADGRFYMGAFTCPTSVAGNSSWGFTGVTLQQVDAYPMKESGRFPVVDYNDNGTPVIDELSGYHEDEFAYTDWTYPAFGGAAEYDLRTVKMCVDRDPRFYVTVFFSGSKWHHGSGMTLTSFAQGANGNVSDAHPKSGFMVNRFYDHTANSAEGSWGGAVTFPAFRLGEIYLNFIEAVLECQIHGVAIPENYKTLAMDLWKELRARVDMKPIDEAYPNASVEELLDLCRKERRVELAFENHRFFDTRTWMIAEQTENGVFYGMNVNTMSKGDVTPDDFWQRTYSETRVFKKQHYLYPFTQNEISLNPQLVQNYGW